MVSNFSRLVLTNSLGLWYEPWTLSLKPTDMLIPNCFGWNFGNPVSRVIFGSSRKIEEDLKSYFELASLHVRIVLMFIIFMCVFKMPQTVFLYTLSISCLPHLLMAHEIPLITVMAE